MLPCLLLFSVIAFYAAASIIWHTLDRSPVEFDQSMYIVRSLTFFQELQSHDFARIMQDFNTGMGVLAPTQVLRPVLVPLLTAVAYVLFGPSRVIALLTISGFTTVLLVFCYLIGKEWEGWRAGALASLLAVSLPVVAIFSRQYLFDVPLAALVAGTVYFLIRRDAFANPVTSVAIGVLAGLGMLTRETYPLFVAGPLLSGLVVFALKVRSGSSYRSAIPALAGLGVGIALAVAMALPFYLPKFSVASGFAGAAFGSADWASSHGIGDASVLDRWLAYTIIFVRGGITIPYLVLLIAALATLAIRRARHAAGTGIAPNRALLPIITSWLLVPYVISSLATANDLRYATAALPAFAVLLAVATVRTTIGRLQPLLLSVVAGYALVQFCVVSFGSKPMRLDPITSSADISASIETLFEGRIDADKSRYMAFTDALAVPRQEDWQVNEMIIAVDELRAQRNIKQAEVFLLSRGGQMNAGYFISSASFESIPVTFYSPAGLTAESSLKLMKQSDFLLVRDKNNGGEDVATLVTKIRQLPFQSTGEEFHLPDGSTVTIYERKR